MLLEFVAHSTDVLVGDKLVSSGLGGVFPEGYPVAVVSKIINDETRPFKQVYVKPLARLERLRHLLLVWPDATPADAESESETTEPSL